MRHLNSDQLRTFLAISDSGSVTAGADRIGRSQSAASLQIKQLEDVIGRPVFHRHGRGVTLTNEGETLHRVARQVTQALDIALDELRGGQLNGKLRVGLPDDHSRADLARIVSEFAARHPGVELEVHCALGSGFDAALGAGALDLAVFEVPEPQRGDDVLRQDSLCWMCRTDFEIVEAEDLPIAVFERDCWWRDLAVSSLKAAGRRHQIVFSSESANGVLAAVQAGIAAALLSDRHDLTGLRPIVEIPARFSTCLVMRRRDGATGPILDAMSDTIRRAFGRLHR
ncbi:MAG: LysR family transcriptional regulator [Pseudomonadota bacterium]